MISYFLCSKHTFLVEVKIEVEFLYPKLDNILLVGKIKAVLESGNNLNLEIAKIPAKLFSARKKSRSRHAAQNAGNRSLPFFIMFSSSTRNSSVLIGNKSQEAVVKLVKKIFNG